MPLALNTTTPAAGSFSTSSTFGFRIDNEYSDDSKNTSNNSGGGHHIRFYPVRDSSGKVVPNTYLMCLDYSNIPQNFDFQDNVYVVSNIRPTDATAMPTDVYATSTGNGNLVQWSSIIDSSVQGYNIYRSTSATGTYTLLNSSPIDAISFLDGAAPSTGTSYYKVTAVDTAHGESLGTNTAVINGSNTSNNGGGSATGSPVALSESVNTLAGNAITINEFPDATDTSGTLIASSVTVTTQPGEGTASVNLSNGAITYTPGAGFTGTDTFQYTVSDNTGAISAPAIISVNVSAVAIGNPVAANISSSTPENTPISVDVVAAASDITATITPTTVTITQAPRMARRP